SNKTESQSLKNIDNSIEVLTQQLNELHDRIIQTPTTNPTNRDLLRAEYNLSGDLLLNLIR
ncbi:unnamed protein product, partial [Rotaria sp. Silwood2]